MNIEPIAPNRIASRNRAPRRWGRNCLTFSAGAPLLAAFTLGACSSDDDKASSADRIGNNANGVNGCEANGDCADGGSSDPTATPNRPDDSEDPGDSGSWTTDEPCADAWMYDGMDLRVFSEATSGEGALDCTEDPDRIRGLWPDPLGIPDHTITDPMARCFEAALTAGYGAYAVERVQGPEYRFAWAWAVTPEGELYMLGQEPMEGRVSRYKCGSLDGYLEGSDECLTSHASTEVLCTLGMPTGAPCDTDDDCRSPLICNLETQRCDAPCRSSECLYPE